MGNRTCSIEGCGGRVRGRGWCNKHLLRAQRHGDPLGGGSSPNPGATCSVEDCDTPHHSKGMCAVHYRRFQRTGQTELSPRVRKFRPTKAPLTIEEQFWVRVEKRDGCWGWNGHIDAKGYARFKVDRIDRFAHRYSYELHHGPIPDGADVDHKCRNRSCPNPEHLHAVSHRENMQNLASLNPRSASGYRGVTLHKPSGKWKAEVRSRGKLHYLGLHATPENAAEVARMKRNELFTNNQEDRRAHILG